MPMTILRFFGRQWAKMSTILITYSMTKKVIIPIFADFGEKVIMSVDFATKVANLQEYVGNISVLINYGSKYRRRIWNYLRLFDEIIYL